MKEGLLTLRGKVLAGEVERIGLFDGRFDTAYRIKSFTCVPQDITTSENVTMKILTEEAAHTTGWFWAKNTEIGWALWDRATSVSPGKYNRVDRDALIVEDIFLDASGDSGEFLNYMIELEKVKITEWVGALAMVRNSSQSVG
jgi:hypothetical protein